MNAQEQRAILTVALLAAFADGGKSEREREEIRRIAEGLAEGGGSELNLPQLYQDVLLKRATLADATAALGRSEHKQLAYEMAVCVCDADGSKSDAERGFLDALSAALGLSGAQAAQAAQAEKQADAFADLITVPAAAGAAAGAAEAGPASAASPAALNLPAVSDAELDKSVLNYAILNGALELLPQSWASMAIIPLQMKMVYAIGQAHGVTLDQGHVKEFIATAGVGLTSQYLEQFGRKLIGGLLGKAMGRTIGGLGRAATGVAFSFATTYALGQLAKRYYAGGRQMNTALLQETFQSLLGPAKQLQQQYMPQIQQKARSLDAGQIMSMVRGR
jgi:uncharacterized protein (DUF697 family)/tellurite resistance protein